MLNFIPFPLTGRCNFHIHPIKRLGTVKKLIENAWYGPEKTVSTGLEIISRCWSSCLMKSILARTRNGFGPTNVHIDAIILKKVLLLLRLIIKQVHLVSFYCRSS